MRTGRKTSRRRRAFSPTTGGPTSGRAAQFAQLQDDARPVNGPVWPVGPPAQERSRRYDENPHLAGTRERATRMAGRGRPEIGNKVEVRLGDLRNEVKAFQEREGIRKEADAIRRLIELGLNRDLASRAAQDEGDES